MAKRASKASAKKSVETIVHDEAKRKNIPTAEYQSVLKTEQQSPVPVRYPRNTDLDPQLVWRGKDEQDWSDLVVHAPPLYIQEKIHPKVLVDDLMNLTRSVSEAHSRATTGYQLDLFADFNGVPEGDAKTEFYQHDQNWSNRMILGDSLQVMASLAEREGLRGRVQCIYFDPPYGIKFNSNFQWSTTSRDVKDGKADHITREPEQVKAFRDTWRDGIHSYLTDSVSKVEPDDIEYNKVCFEPFVGVGPRKFFDLFSMRHGSSYKIVRKDKKTGAKKDWRIEDSQLRLQMLPNSYLDLEIEAVRIFEELRDAKQGKSDDNG